MRTWNRWAIIVAAAAILIAGVALLYETKPRHDPNRVYSIGYGGYWPLHFAEENGNPAGLAVGIIQEAARRRGIRLKWVLSGASGTTGVQTGQMDFWVLAANLPERHKLAYLTEPYLVTEYCFLVPADSRYRNAADLAHARISMSGTSAERIVVPPILPYAALIPSGSPTGAFNALIDGRSDAALLDQYAAGYLALTGTRTKKLRIIPVGGLRYYLSLTANFQVQRVAPELRDEIRVMAVEDALSPLFGGWGFFPRFESGGDGQSLQCRTPGALSSGWSFRAAPAACLLTFSGGAAQTEAL